ncbi:MAG: hypothetical protein GY947_01445 [Rhodobacteraceae bacterium]|nr:hypothetical protein [Paracoccaceae bacterium]
MSIYHYAVIEKPEATLSAGDISNINMENLDYKRQIDPVGLAACVRQKDGIVCGMWRGGMFGLATNQVSILSAWSDDASPTECFSSQAKTHDGVIVDQGEYVPTVRPDEPALIVQDGFYVIRWIKVLDRDIAEYTELCLETWPAFEAAAACRCYGVFRPREHQEVQKILMLTWYASLNDWDISRALAFDDKAKWARRSEMELSHWADGARLIDPALSRTTSN